MRYFDLRGLLPRPQAAPATTQPLPVFAQISRPDGGQGDWALGSGPSRHACPDLAAQLRAAETTKPDALVLSLLDGDATLRLNAALASRFPEELLASLDHLEKRLVPKRTWILLDESAPANWLASLRGAARATRRRVLTLRNDYPESDPTLLLFTLLKRRLKPGALPTDVRAVLLDAPAALAVTSQAMTGVAPSRTPIAVHNPEWPETRYCDVETGTPLSQVLSHFSLNPPDLTLRAGDLLRDQRITADYVITPGGELTFHLHPPERPTNPDPCVRCGWCYEGCPTRVHPAALLEAAQKQSQALARHYGLDACIECGICSYVCPSHLPILPGIRTLKKAL